MSSQPQRRGEAAFRPPREASAFRFENEVHQTRFATSSAYRRRFRIPDFARRPFLSYEELAKVTLARKIIAVTLRLWKKGELWDPTKLTVQAT